MDRHLRTKSIHKSVRGIAKIDIDSRARRTFISRTSCSGLFFSLTGTFSIASSVESAPSITLDGLFQTHN